ncbi:hypothetical protein [Neisseria sp. Marseille-Q6792]|uniref:hypothetical protein n=1 Tax=Neisseria sp. Marseille-Q6792 TaxID=2937985 RepID=UPI002025A3E6|nr:hypothetical protein [Neisseria sp. Marseille-Q6792]
MTTPSFASIYQEIKETDSLTQRQRVRLLSFVDYLQNTKLELLKNITPKRISEITNESEKEIFKDIFYFLCGKKWPLLEPVYRYIDEYNGEPIEIDEDELTEIRETGLIALDNGNIQSQFKPEKLFITFKLSKFSRQLKSGDLI